MSELRRAGPRLKPPRARSASLPTGLAHARADERRQAREAMLARISNRFVQAAVGETDTAISEGLAAISSFVGAERSHVYLFDEDRETMIEVARWPPADPSDADDPLRSIPRSLLPFYAEEVFANRVVALTASDDIPAWAPDDRAFLVRHGVQSCLTVPLKSAGDTIGTLTVSTLTHRRVWNDHDVGLLESAAVVFAPALSRFRSEREQLEALRFERLITSLVSGFMNLPGNELDDGVQRALETIARFVQCDRSALFVLDESLACGVLYSGWWAPGTTPVVEDYWRIEAGPDSPYGQWIASDSPCLILSAAAIEAIRPDSATAVRNTRLGTVANFPLVIDGRRIGWFGIGAPVPRVGWNAAEIRSLGLAANALANMYSRRQSEKAQRRHQRFEDTLSELAADFIKRPPSQLRTGIEELIDRFGSFARSDRAAVLLIEDTDETASTYHEWIARGEPAPIRGFPLREAPWFHQQVMNAEGPWFMYVDDFPSSDQLAADALAAIGIRTLLNCPIADGEDVFGYASIGYSQSRHRPLPGTEQILAVAAGIIAKALSRERLEKQAREQHDALSRALRLGSLGQLATGIAHELNQPLTAIANYSRACVRWLEGADIDRVALAEVLGRVFEEALRAGDIIHNLRNHVKGGPKARAVASIREIVDHACSLLAGTARDRDVIIRTEFRGSLPLVYVEPTDVEQVVINVVQNAIDSIVASNAPLREVRITAQRSRAFVDVVISDTGPGFSEGESRKLFDQFYTTKPGGLGLGLAISRALIESNGGTMTAVASSIGASFRFTLPVASARRVNRRRDAEDSPKRGAAS
jgi:signal transduction histidine kinase